MTVKLTEIPYRRDSSEIFTLVAEEPWSIFLDSGFPACDRGRYDFIGIRPRKTLITRGNVTVINDGSRIRESEQDPFELVRASLGKKINNLTDLPFTGGALGYFSYDLGRRIECIPGLAANDLEIPDMAVGIYDRVVVVDHHKRQAWLTGEEKLPDSPGDWQALVDLFHTQPAPRLQTYSVLSSIRHNMNRQAYDTAFDRIKKYIKDGDCYQVNLTQRFNVTVRGHPWDIYLQLRKNNPAQFAAYIHTPDCSVLSSSPERFLNVKNEIVETRPIKGTIRRASYANEDKALAEQLLESEKDRAKTS